MRSAINSSSIAASTASASFVESVASRNAFSVASRSDPRPLKPRFDFVAVFILCGHEACATLFERLSSGVKLLSVVAKALNQFPSLCDY